MKRPILVRLLIALVAGIAAAMPLLAFAVLASAGFGLHNANTMPGYVPAGGPNDDNNAVFVLAIIWSVALLGIYVVARFAYKRSA